MANTSCNLVASQVLEFYLAGQKPPANLVRDLPGCPDGLFRIVVEGLADRFDRRLCDAYADLFSKLIRKLHPELKDLRKRYDRVRRPRVCKIEPARVIVLSRVTLGADIAITSVILDAVKKRFPRAEVYFAGSEKAAELFACDPRIGHLPIAYPRSGSLQERLFSSPTFPGEDCIVIDPDSRLTQLGLLPVCPDDRYFFFESRAYGGDSAADLTTLTRRWVRETFGIDDAVPYIAPEPVHRRTSVAISFGVGGNPSKRLGNGFEPWLLRTLSKRASMIIIDRGAGGEEALRVNRAVQVSGARNVSFWNGSFAGFASIIQKSGLYIGYDSAGQHAAAVAGTPQITMFRGQVCERMFQRWRPASKSARVLKQFEPQKFLRILPELR